jgi:hypothetical protein
MMLSLREVQKGLFKSEEGKIFKICKMESSLHPQSYLPSPTLSLPLCSFWIKNNFCTAKQGMRAIFNSSDFPHFFFEPTERIMYCYGGTYLLLVFQSKVLVARPMVLNLSRHSQINGIALHKWFGDDESTRNANRVF